MSKRSRASRKSATRGRSLATSIPGPGLTASVSDEECGIATSPKRSFRKESEQKRRVVINQYYDELVMLLSIVTDRVASRKMDKISILHEAVRTIKQYSDLDCTNSQLADAITEYRPRYMDLGSTIQYLLDAMNAFLMVVADNGRILYITELITSLTGHMPTRLIGQSIFDCISEDDKSCVSAMFEFHLNQGTRIIRSPLTAYPAKEFECQFKIGGNESTTVPSRKLSCMSFLRKWDDVPEEDPPSPGEMAMFGIEERLKPQACTLMVAKMNSCLYPVDFPVTTNDVNFQFDMKVSKKGKILAVDRQANIILGYTTSELIGSSFFECVDPYHVQTIGEAITAYISKGRGVSQPYRLTSKSGRYVWVVSNGFLCYSPWNHKLDHVLLQNKVLGCDEILPEFRFTTNKKLIPNLEETEYTPPSAMTAWHTGDAQNPGMYQSCQSLEFNQQLANPAYFQNAPPTVHDPLQGSEMRHELEQKNQDLFALQQKMLQQQQLFQQERSQFYQVTNQVINYIGNQPSLPDASNFLQPNMAVAVSAATTQLSSSQQTSSSSLKNLSVATATTSPLDALTPSHSEVSMLHTQQPPFLGPSVGPKSQGVPFDEEGVDQQYQQHDQPVPYTHSYDNL